MTTDRRRLFDVSWRAIAKVVIAVALEPFVRYLDEHCVPRWLGAAGSARLLAALAAGTIAVSWVSITEPSRFIAENITGFYRHVRASLPA